MAVFSDVDGTLVHYPKNLIQCDNDDGNIKTNRSDLIYLPPSKTGQRGVISSKTLQLCDKLRSSGVPFILVSGMRSTTLFQRLPYLPKADAYVSESGGRIFYPIDVPLDDDKIDGIVEGLNVNPEPYSDCPSSQLKPFTLVEDLDWRNRISNVQCAGSDGYSSLAPRAGSDGFSTLTPPTPIEHRNGKLWEHARTLQEQGYFLDCSGYASAFRVNRKHQESTLAANFDEFLEKCNNKDGVPIELGCSTNLGCVDFYPNMSGKKNVCDYLLRKFLGKHEEPISLKTHACCLCDDDNDVEMALACRKAYLPSITSDSMQKLVNENSDMIVTQNVDEGKVESLATEAALEMVLKETQS